MTGSYGGSFGGNNSIRISGPTRSVVASVGSTPFGRQEQSQSQRGHSMPA